jgi:hypothetical protein
LNLLSEDISRIKEIMGLEEEPNSPTYEGYDDSCDCYPDDVIEGELEEDETEGGEPSTPSSPTMSKWETGLTRGKANPIDQNSKWESGINRGKANPLW